LPPMISVPSRWGTAGLTASAGIAGWIEFALLRRTLNRRLGPTGLPASLLARLWLCALAAASLAWIIKLSTPRTSPIMLAVLVLGPYAVAFLGATLLSRVPEAQTVLSQLQRRLGPRWGRGESGA